MKTIKEKVAIIITIPTSKIISRYTRVESINNEVRADCPFHCSHCNNSKLTIRISDEKGYFKCYTCSAGGDAISFVEKHTTLRFVEAVNKIFEDHASEIQSETI